MRRCALLILALFPLVTSAQEGKRPIRFDDLYAEERMRSTNEVSIARDGAIALVVTRAPSMGRTWRINGCDVLVQLAPGEKSLNITKGGTDETNWRDPLWSPDGTKLLLTSTRGAVRSIWIWDRKSKALKQLSARSVDENAGLSSEGYYEWIDDGRVIAEVLPPNAQPLAIGGEPGPMAAAKAGWQKYLTGQVSASVLETGRTDTTTKKPDVAAAVPAYQLRQIIAIDATSGKTSLVADTYRPGLHHFFKPLLSPDGRFVFSLSHGPLSGTGADDASGSLSPNIYRVDGKPMQLDAPLPGDVLWSTQVWSPDGKEIAFFAYGGPRDKAPKLVRVDVTTGHVSIRDMGDIVVAINRDSQWDFAGLEWTEAGDLVVLSGKGENALKKYARRDWWLLPKSGDPRNLTAQMSSVPAFRRLSISGPLVGVADSAVYKLDGRTGQITPLTDKTVTRVNEIVWPLSDDHAIANSAVGARRFVIPRESRPEDGTVVLEHRDANGVRTYSKLVVSTGQLTPLDVPERGLWLARLTPKADRAFWVNARFDFTRVIATSTIGSAEQHRASVDTVVVLNEWQSAIIAPRDTTIRYTSLYGDASRAWMLLPVGYQPGKKYPMIVRIYPGQQPRPEPLDGYNRIATSAGFIVMVPQMGPNNGRMYGMIGRDVFAEVPSGVLPAIDEAVRVGLVDPDRLFVEGHSMGGFATFSLIEQTNRFKAALAGVGISSWMNGTFSSRGRYGDDVGALNIGWMNDNIQQRPAVATMWSDLGLFIRNSPIFYAERIQTPVFIMSADQDDNVPMSHSEEMFSAMVLLKKRAQYVRYWGEGHAIESPVNVRDLWQRRLAWFDEFGDITRDERGGLVFDGGRVKSRGKAPALVPADYGKFELFQSVQKNTGTK
jgi:dipeptidyl aminopeptidase/acylaminoacyl peptidase